MSASVLLQYLTQTIFVLVFLIVGARAVRRPRRADLDIALLYGVLSLVIALQWLNAALAVRPGPYQAALAGSLLMAFPYLMLRLLADFAGVPTRLMRAAEAGLALAVAGLILVRPPMPLATTVAYVAYFAVIEVYVAARFLREGRRSTGVTRRRMQAVAAGSVCLGLAILLAPFQALLPGLADLWSVLAQALGLACGVAYALGFTPPNLLRRAWQEPELRAFLGRAASLPRLPDTESIVRELEAGAASALGAPSAAVGLWDPERRLLRYPSKAWRGGLPSLAAPMYQRAGVLEHRPELFIAGRAFSAQQAIFTANPSRDAPDVGEYYQAHGTGSVLAAPITAGERRLGVLVATAERAPIFADDDLGLIQLLADQAAVVLESRALIDEAARMQAREEAARLKDDFLSAAAHDLKTPLTTLVAQAQFMERRVLVRPDAPPDLDGIRRMIREAKRLNSLVLELLDAARAEQGRLTGEREEVDLAELARQSCERVARDCSRCLVDAPGPVVGRYDRRRIIQLLDNLLENAVKYSPGGGEVWVAVGREVDVVRLTVRDEGIGIPAADIGRIFDRFHRGTNVDDRQFAGMGLGLFICRGIVEEHGGRIWAESQPGAGSSFHVELPVGVAQTTDPGQVWRVG
ncbi:MAG TPA: ATP-binding protein [Chloroflexota bacterium]